VCIASLCVSALGACGDDETSDRGLPSESIDAGTNEPGLDASVGLDATVNTVPDGGADIADSATGERGEEAFDGGTTRTFYWADWTAATTGFDGGATGFFALPSGGVQVTYKGDLMDVQLEPSARNFWSIKESYTSAAVTKAPDNTDALLIDGVLNGYGEVVFSRPVKDPVFAFASLGALENGSAASYRFDAPFLLLSQGKGFYMGDGWLEKQPNNTLSGQEANGVIGFQGMFTKISWTTPKVEPWHALTIGVAEDVPVVASAP
jgi:hypothetical protein